MDHSQIVSTLYDAPGHPDLWRDAICKVADYIGAHAGNLVYQAPPGGRSFLVPGRMREDLNDLYLQHYANNPYARAYEALPANQVVIGNRLVDADAIRRSAFYADICAPQQIENQIFVAHMSLHQRGGIGGAAFFLSSRESEHEAKAAKRLQDLTPHLSRAIDLTLLTRRLTRGVKLLERLLDVMTDAALLLDRQGSVIRTNPAADRLLRKADGLMIVKRDQFSLTAQAPQDAQRLSHSIRQALAVARREEQELDGSLRITRPSGRPPLLVLITPLPPASFSLWEAVDDGARAMVQIVDLQTATDAQAERLRIIIGLTAAETRVAALVGCGIGVADIARTLGLSLNTVKTHLSHCYQKAGVRTLAAFTRLIASIPATPVASRDLASRDDLFS